MHDVIINVNGGNNQILPNATEAVQNFYGDHFAEKKLSEQEASVNDSPEAEKLAHYLSKDHLQGYLAQIRESDNATELANIVISMLDQEPKLTKEIIVKECFIKLLLPFAAKNTSGKSVNNIRARINDALIARRKGNNPSK